MTLRSLWTQHEAWLSLIAIFISPCFHHNLVLYHMFCPRYAFFLLYFFLGCSPFILFHRSYNKSFPHWVQMGRSLHKLHWLNPKFSGKVMFEMAHGCAYGAILRLEQNSGYRLFRVEQRSPSQRIVTKNFSIFEGMKKFCYGHSAQKKQNLQSPSNMNDNRSSIDSSPGSSPPERPDQNNIACQPFSDLTYPRTTSDGAFFRFVTLFYSLKGQNKVQKVVIRGQVQVRQWLSVILSRPGRSKGISQVSRRLEVDNKQCALNYQLSSGTSAHTSPGSRKA